MSMDRDLLDNRKTFIYIYPILEWVVDGVFDEVFHLTNGGEFFIY